MAGAYGTLFQVGIGASDPVDLPLECTQESIALRENFIDTSGMRGTRAHASERVRRGTRNVSGTLTLTPTPLELDYLLPWIAGGTKSGNIIALAETVPNRYITIDRDEKVVTYSECKVDSASFRASVGGPLEVVVSILGKDETIANAGTFPAISTDITGGPYVLSDLALTIASTTYQCTSIEVVHNNAIEQQYFNSETVTRSQATDRVIGCTITLPYGDALALHGSALAGVAVVATFTNSTRSFQMSMAAVQAPRNSAVNNGRGETFLQWSGIARKSSTTAEIIYTNDSTV